MAAGVPIQYPICRACPARAGRRCPWRRVGIGLVQHAFICRARATAVLRPQISAARPRDQCYVSEHAMESSCALCRQVKVLKKSHVIPNAAFKKIKRSLHGKSIVMTDDDHTPIQYSSESWWEYLLCGECEDLISRHERYFFDAIRRNKPQRREIHSQGLTLKDISYHNIKLFLESLIWRAGVSSQDHFHKVVLHPTWLEDLRTSLHSERPLSQYKYGCKISKLNDPTPGGFSRDSLDQLVISPIQRIKKSTVSYLFVIEGFLLEFFCPAIPFSRSRDYGIIRKTNNCFIPYQPICDIPEIMRLMVKSLDKEHKGMVKFMDREHTS